MKSFGSFLKYIRKNKDLTQDQVAEKLHIVTPVLSKWENDKAIPSLELLCRLCNVLEISLEDCIVAEKTPFSDLPPAEYSAVKLGNTIKELRRKNGWSQSDVGKKLFVSSQTVSKWEKGGVTSLDILRQLAELYNLSPTQLVTGLEQQQQTPISPKPKKKRKKLAYVAVLLAIIAAIAFCSWGIVAAVTRMPSLCLPVDDGYVYRTHRQLFENGLSISAHRGIDIKVEEGASVYAVADGTISIEGEVTVRLTFGSYEAIYSGVQPLESLADGQKVKRGECIAIIAQPNYAESDDGAHLHFELQKGTEELNPLDHLPEMLFQELPETPTDPEEDPSEEPETPTDPEEEDPSEEPETPTDPEEDPSEEPETPTDPEEDPSEEPETPTDPEEDPSEEPETKRDFANPVAKIEIMATFEAGVHNGVDFVAGTMFTAVYAIDDGVVKEISYLDDTGSMAVTVDHGDGVVCIYRYIISDELYEGKKVAKGDRLGTVQMPSDSNAQRHLHFELWLDGEAVDPLTLLPSAEQE